MQKQYNFWMLPKDKFHQDEQNPYSAINGSLTTAKNWAEHMLWCNNDAIGVEFKAENGQKLYTIMRTKASFIA